MNIVCATDNNFVQHCAVTLVSILKNNPKGIFIYLLTEGLTDSNEDILKQLVIRNGGEIDIILVNSEALKDCPMPNLSDLNHISIATYYRLMISKLLPIHVNKAIYFDCDIIVRHSLNELWNYDIQGLAIGAVYQIADWNISAIKRLGYPVNFGYFNAGVLLINLKYWRDNNISEKLFEYLHLKKEVIVFHDQDALNGLLHQSCLRLPCKWNMITGFFRKNILRINDVLDGEIINTYSDYKKQILLEKDDPAIIHYVYKPKPWDVGCTHPYKSEYFNYLQHTPWRNYKVPKILSVLFKTPQLFCSISKAKTKRVLSGNPYFKVQRNS
jgi:lipopolysaccharide biosynthesis glycosyltransferase